jgi:hypothetical protein
MIMVWCELVCVTCSKTTSGNFTTGAVPRVWMKREAKERGWKFVGLAKTEDCACSQACLDRYIAERKST